MQRESILRPAAADAPGAEAAADAEGGRHEPREEAITVRVSIARAVGLPQADFMGTADPYVELRLVVGNPLNSEDFQPHDVQKRKSKAMEARTIFKAQTQVIRGTLTPVWDESFAFEVPNSDAADGLFLYFRVYDYDLVRSDDFLGHVSVGLLDAIVAGKELNAGWRALLRKSSVGERLGILRDERLRSRPPGPHRLQPVPGQETTYDLSVADLLLSVNLPQKLSAAKKVGAMSIPNPLVAAERERLISELMRATVSGDVPLVYRILGQGAEVNARASSGPCEGCAPLHIACLKGHTDLAMALVDVFDASLVQPAPGGRSGAMCACEAGDEGLAEWLIAEGVPADLRDDANQTVLFYAARAALPQLTSWLIGKQRLQPGERAADGSTPLIVASSGSAPAAVVVVQQLLDASASANVANDAGQAPLHAACQVGNDKCVRLLLRRGLADAGAVDAKGQTAFDIAVQSGLPESTIKKLAASSAEAGDDGMTQQRGETAAAAEKRELRARKAEQSEESNWRTWRSMRPRRDLLDGGAADAGDSFFARAEAAEPGGGRDDEYFAAFGASARPGVSSSGVHLTGDHSPGPSGKVQRKGRLSRLRAWATSLRRRSTSSRAPQSPDSGGSPRRQDSWSS